MVETTKTAAPSRARTAVKKTTTATKPRVAAKKPATVTEAVGSPAETKAAVTGGKALVLTPHPGGNSTNYSKWIGPDDEGMTGAVYLPLGVTEAVIYIK